MYEFDCSTCGRYKLAEVAKLNIEKDSFLRGCLSIATREASDSGKPLTLEFDTWREHALAFAGTTVGSKIRGLLDLLRQRAPVFGEPASFSAVEEWPLIHAVSLREAEALIAEMRAQRLLREPAHFQDGGLTMTMEGWNAAEPLVGGVPGLGFAAMSFDDSLSPAYDAMKAAVETDCGLRLIRVDAEHFQDKICDRIIADIRRSEFVIADFTLQRGGVYFEAGFALALGRIVIWTCRENDLANVHFDTRQYPHIVWNTPEDLRTKLTDRVRALVPGART